MILIFYDCAANPVFSEGAFVLPDGSRYRGQYEGDSDKIHEFFCILVLVIFFRFLLSLVFFRPPPTLFSLLFLYIQHKEKNGEELSVRENIAMTRRRTKMRPLTSNVFLNSFSLSLCFSLYVCLVFLPFFLLYILLFSPLVTRNRQ